MKKSVIVSVSVVAIAVAAAFYLYNRPGDADGSRKITIAQFGDFFLYAPLYVAIDNGYFAENGLSVALLNTGGDDKTWASVISGEASFGVADPTFVAIADGRGQPGRVVASLVAGVPFWGVALGTNVPRISKRSELDGHTVATFPSPSTAYTLQKDMFEDGGLPPSIKQGSFGTQLAAVQAGEADIALLLEPNASQAVKKHGATVVYGIADYYEDFAVTGLTTSVGLIENDPQLVEAVVCSIHKALSFIHAERDKTTQLLVKRFPEVDAEASREALNRLLNASIIPANATISQKGWDAAVSLRKEVGDLKMIKPWQNYVDNTFASKVSSACTYTAP